MKDLNIKFEAVNYVEENISIKLMDLGFREEFMNLIPSAKQVKAKINEWGYIILKSFCTAKEMSMNTERQPTELEEIFSNNSCNTGLISKIYKKLIQFNTKQTIQ